jgi:hypothetical protein
MIVLDEQLLGRDLETTIATWYPGTVCFIHELRPNTIVKDEAIPSILQHQRQPTFITINERDFWLKIAADPRYCVICFALPDSQARMIPPLLRSLLRRPSLRTKAKRMGQVIRVTKTGISYYTSDDDRIKILDE